MKYNVGDKVLIKSLDWYNENKDKNGNIVFSSKVPHFALCVNARTVFTKDMVKFCGKVVTIESVWTVNYSIGEGIRRDYFTDEMIEGLVKEETKNNNDMEEKETLLGWVKENDSLRLVPHKDYEIKHDGDNFYLVKKKKEYPKTFEECCKILGLLNVDLCFNADYRSFYASKEQWKRLGLMNQFYQLLICRDAYWKIAGEEMGLDKPWEPNWKNSEERRYSIVNIEGDINLPEKTLTKWILKVTNKILVFPTEEMRDAFKENFDPDIEICKELL